MKWPDFLRDPAVRQRARMLELCKEREQLSDAEYYQKFFANSGAGIGSCAETVVVASEHTVAEIRKLFSHALGDVFYLIYPDDDWSKEFQPLWDLDSMANVELVTAMEEVFDITLSEVEASGMTSLRKTAEVVTAKLLDRSGEA